MENINDKLGSYIYLGEKKSFFKIYILPMLVFFNYLFIALYILALASTSYLNESSKFEIPNIYWAIYFIGCPFLMLLIVNIIYSKHVFFEWDLTERKKKKEFQMTVMLVVVLCTYIFGFLALQASVDLYMTDRGILAIEIFYSFIFLCNAIFTVPLHNVIYKDNLMQNNIRTSKPKNWDCDYEDIESFIY